MDETSSLLTLIFWNRQARKKEHKIWETYLGGQAASELPGQENDKLYRAVAIGAAC